MNRRLLGAGGAAAVAGGIAFGLRAQQRRVESNSHATVRYGTGQRLERHATIAREPADVYAAWRDLARLPLVMPNLERVEELDATRSRWTTRGPAGVPLVWEAELIDDRPGERIAWRTDQKWVAHAGTVRFAPAPGNRGTEVAVEIEITTAAGVLGRIATRFAQLPPQRLLEVDVRRFKSMLECGDVALNGTDVIA